LEGLLEKTVQHAYGSGRPPADSFINIFGAPLAGMLALTGYLALRNLTGGRTLAVVLLLAVPVISALVVQLAFLVFLSTSLNIPSPG
jgi:hypothetical protein